MKKGSWYQAAKLARSMMVASAQSSLGEGSVLPHGVVILIVSDQLEVSDGPTSKDATQRAYFSSQLSPESAGQAMPALRASGVSRSSHWFFTDHAIVRA